ncbi:MULTISPECIES: YtxH domain-containing protein [Reichenbachiella]|uniref:Gas vesicle protein n=1 Tax=Reichenbachiella agariperforans TaxID=156994 RepID=A0A1M6WAA9_REIAG|nr:MULTISPECIES: YtxH domain-containing protein [Reichenbachiella]MBU2915179.1 YtxH domain-containing protein [Reichenbachiella agariperforans]RJE70331.1 gas vesicle protein [Reichenbachiella sp. MSK19-1]SHK90704.1 Gas vesicle protein [Reichenbachiella agariperforans]
MSKNSNSFLAFLTGAAAGALFGILYAPDKGENTRDKLTYRLDKYRKKLDEAIQDFVDGKELSANDAKTEGQKIVDDAKEKAEKLLDDVNGLINQIKGEEVA